MTEKPDNNKKVAARPIKDIKAEQQKREAEQFKRKYFDYYDDVKISVKEDW